LGWLGWIAFPSNWLGRLPLEVYSPEAFGFLALLGLPHLAAARAFLLFGLIQFLHKSDENQWMRSAIFGGLCWLVTGIFQPLTIVVGYGILGCYFLLILITKTYENWQSLVPMIKKAVVIVVISSPWVIYNFLSFTQDSYLKAWYAQNIIQSPPFQDYLWSYGLFVLAAIPANVRIFKEKDRRRLLLIAWLLCAAGLAYFPYNVQRRFIDGVWIALVILMIMNYELISQEKSGNLYKGLIGLSAIAPILVMLVALRGAWVVSTPVYRPTAQVVMFNAIANISQPGDVILSSYDTGNALPAWAPVYVLAGHGPESANLKTILPEVEAFFSGEKDLAWQKSFILRNDIQYIVVGPRERALGSWENKYGNSYISIYNQGGYQVFKVELTDGK
ncbi:MAG TPA: hypothetical protein VF338_00810, partial [Leptolinea sp.]